MKSPLEYLAWALDNTPLGDAYSLEGIIYDDDAESSRDQAILADYGFAWHPDRKWIFPADLRAQGKLLLDMVHAVPSAYRRLPLNSTQRVSAKSAFERALLDKLQALGAVLLLDGLLVILDELVRPGAHFHRSIVNIHRGITRIDSPYERRGAYATLDALHGAQGGARWKRTPCQRFPRPLRRCITSTTASTAEKSSSTRLRPTSLPTTRFLNCAGTTSTEAFFRRCTRVWRCWRPTCGVAAWAEAYVSQGL